MLRSSFQRKRKYKTPEIKTIDTAKLKNVSRKQSHEPLITRKITDRWGRVIAVIRENISSELSQKETKIIERLIKDAGLKGRIEEPFYQTINGKKRRLMQTPIGGEKAMVFTGQGKGLINAIIKNPFLAKNENIFNQILDIIGKVHQTEIAHGHPHLNNFTIKKINGKKHISLIDFKFAKDLKGKIVWKDPYSVFDAFKDDYYHFVQDLFKIKKEKNIIEILRKLMTYYPCSKEVKEGIIEIIWQHIGEGLWKV
jgi:tRNA A-37 threonylcarbamoyl transferase component Bud32